MKKILTYAALAAISLAFVGCNREFDAPIRTEEEGISLNLFCLDPALTKAVPEATATENAITSLEYFFFKGEDASKPALRKRVTNPSFTNNVYSIKFTADGKAADFNNVTLNDLFTADGKSEFFVVTNAPEIGEKSLTAVKNTAAELRFATLRQNDPDNTGYDAVYTTPFVMTGAITLHLGDLTKDVELKRLAAKMTFDVNVAKIIEKPKTVDGAQVTETWRPILAGNNVRIFPSNVAFNAVLGGTDVAEPKIGNYNPEHFRVGNAEIAGNPVDGYTNLETVESSWALPTSPAFYTYPRTWKAGEKTEPYIKLIVPWMMERKDANGNVIYSTQKELYYKVMLNDLKFVSNGWYNYTINVDVLGNEADDPVVIIPAAYVVEDWNTVLLNRINSVMTEAMFLSVDKKEVTFYTAASPNVNITASDAVTPYIVSITQKNLLTGQSDYVLVKNDAAGNDIGRYNTTLANIKDNWVKLAGSGGSYTLEIEHALNNDITSDSFDATEYTFVVKLLLEGDTAEKYAKTVTFTQIPQIYVKEDPNRGLNSGTTSVVNGGVYLNTYTIGSDYISQTVTFDRFYYRGMWGWEYSYMKPLVTNKYNYLGGVHGLTGNNRNGNMYVLTISVSNQYAIGDPRTPTVSIPPFTYGETYRLILPQGADYLVDDYQTINGVWKTAKKTKGADGTLTNYHPTSSDNTSNMIAPKIRVASSYGVCTTGISESNAIARCAAYQEDGIPAGRWRLPTMAEVQFISTLSTKGRIPYLFGSSDPDNDGAAVDEDSYYWTANGLIHVNNGSNPPVAEPYIGETNPGGETVRCVYDEWFWGDAMTTRPVAYNQFTWGDEAY